MESDKLAVLMDLLKESQHLVFVSLKAAHK